MEATEKKHQMIVLTEPLAKPPGAPTRAQVVVGYGAVPPQPAEPDMKTIYLSIFTLLFCCWPCGLVGLIYGIQGMQQHYRGQYDSAERTTNCARKWTICGIVSGVTFFIIFVIGYTLGIGLGIGLDLNPDMNTTTDLSHSYLSTNYILNSNF